MLVFNQLVEYEHFSRRKFPPALTGIPLGELFVDVSQGRKRGDEFRM